MEECEKKTGGPPPKNDHDGNGVAPHSLMPPSKRPLPQPGRGEYQPPSEYSISGDDPSRRPPPDAPDDCSEGHWIRWDSAELQRHSQMHSQPEASVPDELGLSSSPPPFYEQPSALDLLASSRSSSTEDEPNQQVGDGVPPAVQKPRRSTPPKPPPPPPPSTAVDKRASLPPGGRQHGTEDSHIPYWDVHRVHSLDDEECLGDRTLDYLPAVLQIYDTESTQEDTSTSAAGDDFGTGGEAATAIAGGETGNRSPYSDTKRRRTSWLCFDENGVRDLPVEELEARRTRVEASVKDMDAHPTNKTLAEIQTLATKPASDAALAEGLPVPPSPATNVSEKETASTKPPVSDPTRISADLSAAGTPDTKRHPSRSQSTTKTEVDSSAPKAVLSHTDQEAVRTDQKLEPRTESSQPSGIAHSPALLGKLPDERPLRLQRTPLPGKQSEKGEDRSGKVTPAVPYNEEKRSVSYFNELELHNTVAVKLQRIPMRLLLFDLFLAFLLVIFSHMEMLGLEGNATTLTTPSQGPILFYERPVCRGAACSAAGINLFYTLNESADACRSIFDMVCRPWVHEAPSVYHRALVGSARLATATVFEETSKFLYSRLRKVLPSTSQGKLASLYASCRDHEERDRAGLAYFRVLLRRYQLDRWPFDDDHKGLSRPQSALELFMRDTGAEPYFTLRVRQLRNRSTLAVGCPLLGLPPLSFISKTADVGRYTDYVGSVLKLVSGPSASLRDVPATVVGFETRLARLHVESCKESGTYSAKSLRDLVDAKWNWEHFLQEVTEGAGANDHLQSASWEYASNVTGFIVSDTVPAANYFGWKVVSRLAPYTTTSMEDAYNAFLEATGLETHRPSRRCLTQVNRVLPFAMGRVYAMISPETSTNYQAFLVAHEVARSLDTYMVKDGQPLAPEIETLYRKLRSTMDMTMGYPDWVKDEASVDAYYEPVTIGGSYLESHLSAAKVTYQRSFDPEVSMGGRERLMFPEDPERWTLDPAWLSLYDIQGNRFYILPAMLQPPYYVEGTAHSLNYGGLGFLLARTILSELFSHSVESTLLAGSPSLAKSVRLLRARLLESSSAGAANGSSEALAASIAYLSYQMHGDFSDEQTVEGAETITPDQLFFIAVARTLCTLVRSRYYVRIVGQRSHVDALSEIDNTLLALPEYRDAFSCYNGTLR